MDMHESIFSYNLSRPYPFKWFTPLVLTGSAMVTVLVTLLSIETSGYEIVTISTPDPNATLKSDRTWFGRHLGDVISIVQPSCESTTIPLNTVLYTNNTALAYTLDSIATIGSGNVVQQGSLVYQNNPLQDCQISSIAINFEGFLRQAQLIATQQIGAVATCFVDCTVHTGQGPSRVSLSTSYDYLREDVNTKSKFMSFHGRNAETQASLYWAESMLLMYWLQLTNLFDIDDANSGYSIYKAFANFTGNSDPPKDPLAIQSLDFFSLAESYLITLNNSYPNGFATRVITPSLASHSISELTNASMWYSDVRFPNIWIPADSLSKALYYTVLTDLGQDGASYVNIMTDPSLLQYFTRNFSIVTNSSSIGDGSENENVIIDPGLATLPYDEQSSLTGPLRINPSVLAGNYLCQIPQLKPIGSRIVAVLVADLVLLKTIWEVFKVVTDYFLLEQLPKYKQAHEALVVLAAATLLTPYSKLH